MNELNDRYGCESESKVRIVLEPISSAGNKVVLNFEKEEHLVTVWDCRRGGYGQYIFCGRLPV